MPKDFPLTFLESSEHSTMCPSLPFVYTWHSHQHPEGACDLQPRHSGDAERSEPPVWCRLLGWGREGKWSPWESCDLGCGFLEGRECAVIPMVCGRLLLTLQHSQKAPFKCLCDVTLLVTSFPDVNSHMPQGYD